MVAAGGGSCHGRTNIIFQKPENMQTREKPTYQDEGGRIGPYLIRISYRTSFSGEGRSPEPLLVLTALHRHRLFSCRTHSHPQQHDVYASFGLKLASQDLRYPSPSLQKLSMGFSFIPVLPLLISRSLSLSVCATVAHTHGVLGFRWWL